jgi:hypothetical protein
MLSLIDLLAEAGWITGSYVDDKRFDVQFTEEGRIKLSMLDALLELGRPLTEKEQECLATLIKEHGFPRP